MFNLGIESDVSKYKHSLLLVVVVVAVVNIGLGFGGKDANDINFGFSSSISTYFIDL